MWRTSYLGPGQPFAIATPPAVRWERGLIYNGVADRGSNAGARIRTWELLREQILSLPPLAARPPRHHRREETELLIPVPFPRRAGRSRHRSGLRGLLRPAGALEARGRSEGMGGRPAAGRGSCVADRIEGTFGRGGRTEGGSSRFGPRPSTSNTIGSIGPDTRPGVARCSASRCDVPARRTGPRARGDPPPIPVPRARRGRRPDDGRCEPSPRSADPGGRSASGLGLLAYRAIDRDAADDGPAPNAVLPRRGRRHRTHRSGNRGGQDRVPRGRIDPGGACRTEATRRRRRRGRGAERWGWRWRGRTRSG